MPSGTAGGRTASAKTPCSSAWSTIRRGELGVADDERDDVGRGAADVEALAGQAVAQRLGVGAQLLDAAGLLLQQVQRGHRRGGRDRRQRGRVQQRAGGVHEEAGGDVVAGRRSRRRSRAPCPACR